MGGGSGNKGQRMQATATQPWSGTTPWADPLRRPGVTGTMQPDGDPLRRPGVTGTMALDRPPTGTDPLRRPGVTAPGALAPAPSNAASYTPFTYPANTAAPAGFFPAGYAPLPVGAPPIQHAGVAVGQTPDVPMPGIPDWIWQNVLNPPGN